MLENLKAALKLLLLLAWMIVWFGPIWLAYRLGKFNLRDRMMCICSMGILRIIGVRVTVTGSACDIRPLLLVTNHISYLDVVIINSIMRVHFTPKIEIADWPVMGTVSRMSGGIFVDRRPEKLVEMKQNLQGALTTGRVVCLFPESTTGNGLHILPFKSGFFSLAEDTIEGKQLTVQPAAITYNLIRKLPIDTTQWPSIAWYGDMVMLPHLWNLLKLTPIDAELVFLSPTTLTQHENRKKLAAHCQSVITETIQSIRNRRQDAHPHGKRLPFHPRFLRIKS